MAHCRLQLGCLLLVIYIAFIYYKDCKKFHKKMKATMYDEILILSMFSIIFDGITAVTVNYADMVNPVLNKILHLLFFLSVESIVYLLYVYMLWITDSYPSKKRNLLLVHGPYVFSVILMIVSLPNLQFLKGEYTYYSMGVSVYSCYVMVAVYFILSLSVYIRKWNYIESKKRVSILTYLLAIGGVAVAQAIVPELLLTSVVAVILVLGIYMNQEDPNISEIERYHSEMVMSFATLVENKDGSTGEHVTRTTAYVRLLAAELRAKGYYREVLTKDYVRNLCQSAPMHDIGKIAVPDVILQKPGKLTDEEFAVIKLHTVDGGRIIEETFGNLGNDDYTKMAYNVAKYHHEKWNGKGYPEGLKEEEIPLCARIMSVADVFDAVSEKRCYRDAMPLDVCFDIIRDGIGKDFDPIIAQVFIDAREKVERIHNGG